MAAVNQNLNAGVQDEDGNNGGGNNQGNLGDPLYLSNSDHPGAQLVGILFDGSNFMTWSRGIMMALGAKCKLGFIDGTCGKPNAQSADLQRWIRADFMVRCWLLNSMNKNIAEGFMFMDSSRQLWDDIVERFGQSNAPLIFQIKRKLSNVTQGGMSLPDMYNTLKRHWDELQVMEGIPEYTCGVMSRCTCDLKKKLIDIQSTNRVMQLLMSLNDGYEAARNQILAMDPLPNINRAYYILQQVEKGNDASSSSQSNNVDASAFSVNKGGQGFKPRAPVGNSSTGSSSGSGSYGNSFVKKDWKKIKAERKCNHCGRNGHTAEECFKLHGIPEWFKELKEKERTGSLPMRGSANAAGSMNGGMQDNPLDDNGQIRDGGEGQMDSAMVNVVFQEVMRKMKTRNNSESAFANFAGPWN